MVTNLKMLVSKQVNRIQVLYAKLELIPFVITCLQVYILLGDIQKVIKSSTERENMLDSC